MYLEKTGSVDAASHSLTGQHFCIPFRPVHLFSTTLSVHTYHLCFFHMRSFVDEVGPNWNNNNVRNVIPPGPLSSVALTSLFEFQYYPILFTLETVSDILPTNLEPHRNFHFSLSPFLITLVVCYIFYSNYHCYHYDVHFFATNHILSFVLRVPYELI